MSTVLASGADERYGHWLLNMVGSVQKNAPGVFDRIVLFDLGLTPLQERLARAIRGAEVRTVPPFVAHWREGRTWKTWIWTHVEAERLVWFDAGLSVLRPLDELVAQIDERGYFVVSQGVPVGECTPPEFYEELGFSHVDDDRTTVASGILGFRTSGPFYSRVIVPTYEDAVQGRTLGFSAADVDRINTGMDRNADPIIRDCRFFRWDQSVFNVRFYLAVDDPVVNDIDKFAGWKSATQHPEQVIWSHRRRGDFRFMPHIRYRGWLAPFGFVYGWGYRLNWWRVNHSWLFKPSTYARKAARLLRLAP